MQGKSEGSTERKRALLLDSSVLQGEGGVAGEVRAAASGVAVWEDRERALGCKLRPAGRTETDMWAL